MNFTVVDGGNIENWRHVLASLSVPLGHWVCESLPLVIGVLINVQDQSLLQLLVLVVSQLLLECSRRLWLSGRNLVSNRVLKTLLRLSIHRFLLDLLLLTLVVAEVFIFN